MWSNIAIAILVLGDSLSMGAFATTTDRGYAALLGASVGATPGRLEGAEADWYGRSATPGAVVLEVGINDTLTPTMSEAEWLVRYRALGLAIQASGARLVCVTPFDVGVEAEAIARRAELVRRACPGIVADVYAVTRGRSDLRARVGEPTQYRGLAAATDGLHPNDAGHALIAERVRVALRPRDADTPNGSLTVYPTPVVGRSSQILLVAHAQDDAGQRTLTLTVDPTVAVVTQCNGVLFTGSWPPAVLPCVISGHSRSVTAALPPRAVLTLFVEVRIIAAGEFVVDATIDNEALSYETPARWQTYAPLIGGTP